MVPQDVPQLQLAAAAAEALPRTGGGAGLQQLAWGAQAGAGGAAAPRLTEAVRRQVPQLAHGFNQRPRFEQVVGYLERNEPLPLDQPDRKATSFVTSRFYLDDFVQSSEDPNPWPLQHTPLQAIPEDGCLRPALTSWRETLRLLKKK